jgi:hypothetical protein
MDLSAIVGPKVGEETAGWLRDRLLKSPACSASESLRKRDLEKSSGSSIKTARVVRGVRARIDQIVSGEVPFGGDRLGRRVMPCLQDKGLN